MRHLHLRKRSAKGLVPYPAHTRLLRLLDAIVYAAGMVGPFATMPQVLIVYIDHNVAGISIFTWLAWAILDIPWVIYGFVHKNHPIIITYTLWALINLSVVIGVILYR